MKQHEVLSPHRRTRLLTTTLLALLLTALPAAATDLLLSRDTPPESDQYKGIVTLVVQPGFDASRVAISVDGERLIEALRSPYRIQVDFGPRVIQHKITVTAWNKDRKHVQWSTTVNKGHQALTVRLRPIDVSHGTFQAVTTAAKDDPVEKVEVWNDGGVVASATAAPWHLKLPAGVISDGFVQVTARTRSGEEAADFWSPHGEVRIDNVDVRTVPLYVSVVDRNGTTRDDVDRSLFRVIDGNTEGKIIQFSKAFNQPITIALLLDASASMSYSMKDATRAATGFIERTMRQGDRCVVYAIRDVPRRQVELTEDRAAVLRGLNEIKAQGETALYDAINFALRDLKNETNRRAIVVLTDGSDNDSVDTWEDVDQKSREAGVPIYFLAYESLEPTAQQDYDRMNYLAAQTGGFVTMAKLSDLDSKYREIEKDLRAQFAIVYQIADYTKRNEWRKVHVVMSSPKLTARTIGGYFAP